MDGGDAGTPQFTHSVLLTKHLKVVDSCCIYLSMILKIPFRFLKFHVLCMCVSPACMHMRQMCSWCPQRSEEGVSSPEAGIMDGL